MTTFNDMLVKNSGKKMSEISAFQSSMIRQSIRNIAAVRSDGVSHYLLMKCSEKYRTLVSENVRLSGILHEKETKLALSDAQVSSLSESVRYLSDLSRQRKNILRANNLL